MSSRNATPSDFDFVIECIRSGRLNIDGYITHRLHFSTFADEFKTITDNGQNVLKAVIDFDK